MNKISAILKATYGYLKVFSYDTYRFVRYSGTLRSHSHAPSRAALMTKYYHMVEKGLALPNPRPGFGVEVTENLGGQIRSALRDNTCHQEVALSADALEGYVAFNTSNATASPAHVVESLRDIRAQGVETTGHPLRHLAGSHAEGRSNLDFLKSRASVREFSDDPVPTHVLLEAARAAQFAPCVCNRQAGRVYFLTTKEEKAKALSYQKGNRGFGDLAPVIAIITVDIAELLEPTERYQHWIDGGLFAQNLLLAIHAQGYGACPLNWSAPITRDIGIRKLGYLPASESIIMMVAIGALKEGYRVARSERRPLNQVARFIGGGDAQ